MITPHRILSAAGPRCFAGQLHLPIECDIGVVPDTRKGDACVKMDYRLRAERRARPTPHWVPQGLVVSTGAISMMKRKFAAVLMGLSLMGAVSTAAAQDKELIVATDTAFIPFEFKQGNTYTGFDIDLWAAIAKELDLNYKLQPMDFNGIIPG